MDLKSYVDTLHWTNTVFDFKIEFLAKKFFSTAFWKFLKKFWKNVAINQTFFANIYVV